jgi:hypothetical protein
MKLNKTDAEIQVCNTDLSDLKTILWLFDEAIKLQNKNGYKVWDSIDEMALQKEITNNLQFKVVKKETILCIFSIQSSDPFIWQDKEQNDAMLCSSNKCNF